MIAGHHSILGLKKPPTGCHILVRMTAETGLSLTFVFRNDNKTLCPPGDQLIIDWGDGTSPTVYTYTSSTDNFSLSHTYGTYGEYDIVFTGFCLSFGFAQLDGSTFNYSKAPISIIDYTGVVGMGASGAFKSAINLQKLILPFVTGMGQRDFAYCTSLTEVELGCPTIYYDGVFQGCTALTSFKVNYDVLLPRWKELYPTWTETTFANRSCTCWHSVWNGCSSIKELNVGHITQFGNTEFTGCSSLTDVYITNRTTSEIKNSFGKSYKFPWGAGTTVKFHGTDGYVLGDGTIVTN